MAKAAEETADWTFGQILATGVEAILLAIAIGIASWAGYWAKRAAVATAETAKIASDTAKRQLRAYVAQEIIVWKALEQPKSKTIHGYNLTVRWKNCGSTPARRCRTWFSIGSFENGFPKDFDYPDALAGKVILDTEKAHIGPNGTVANTVGCTVAATQATQSGKTKIFAWGWVEYDDIFQGTPRRRTEVCFQVVIGPDGRSFDPMITGPFNGADEDCHHQPKT